MAATLSPDPRSSAPMPPMPDETADTPLLSGQSDLKSDVRLLAYQVASLDKKLDRSFEKAKNSYKTKSEMKDFERNVDKLNANIGWLVKIIGAVVIALLGLVIVKGGVAQR